MRVESKNCKWMRRVGGSFSIFLGLIYTLSWLAEVNVVLTPNSRILPMQLNSALLFFVSGFLFLRHHRMPKWLMRGVSGSAAILCLILVFLIYLGKDWGLDQFFKEDHLFLDRDFPGRMTAKSAISFLLIFLALFCSGWRGTRHILAISSTMASAAAVFGFIDFFSFLQNFESLHGMSTQVRMPLPASIGFIVLGGMLASYFWEDSREWEVGIPLWTSVVVLMAGLSVTAISFNAAVAEDTFRMRELTRSASNHYHDILFRSLETTGKAVRRMGMRWKFQSQTILEWDIEAAQFLQDVPHFEALGISSQEGRVLKVKLRRGLAYEDLGEVEDIVRKFKEENRGLNSSRFHLTEAFFIKDKVKAFAYISPINNNPESDFFFAIINVKTLFSVTADKDILPNFNFDITDLDHNYLIYVRSPAEPMNPIFTVWRKINVGGQDWTLKVAPTDAFLSNRKMAIVGRILALGVSVSILIALLVLFIQLAQNSRKQVQKTANRLQAILNGSTRISIIATDLNGVITTFNSGAESMLGYRADELVGKQTSLIFHMRNELSEQSQKMSGQLGREMQPFEVLTEEARLGKFEEKNWTYIRKDGSTLPVNLIVTPIYLDVEIVGFLEIAVDVTKTERQLREYAKQLEIAYRELEQFSYIASHDLKEPMRNLISYSQLLEEDIGPNLTPDAADDLKYIKQSAMRLGRLVDDLLNLSRAGRSEVKKSEVSIEKVLADTKKSLESLLEESKAKIVVVGELPKVYVDENLFVQLFANIVTNAVKFVDVGVTSVIEISGCEKDGNVHLDFKDNGIGIQEKYLKQIFAPFKRLHGMNKYEGTGIGLSICQKIVERHDGEIWVESTPGVGSIFHVVIPVKK